LIKPLSTGLKPRLKSLDLRRKETMLSQLREKLKMVAKMEKMAKSKKKSQFTLIAHPLKVKKRNSFYVSIPLDKTVS
jgi:hypothetical protein